jgi:hypothetical protein
MLQYSPFHQLLCTGRNDGFCKRLNKIEGFFHFSIFIFGCVKGKC